jgi:hypothetical protein
MPLVLVAGVNAFKIRGCGPSVEGVVKVSGGGDEPVRLCQELDARVPSYRRPRVKASEFSLVSAGSNVETIGRQRDPTAEGHPGDAEQATPQFRHRRTLALSLGEPGGCRGPHGEFKVPRTLRDLHVRGPVGTRRDGCLKHFEGWRAGPRAATCAITWNDDPGHRPDRRSRARQGSERTGQRPAADFELAVPRTRRPRACRSPLSRPSVVPCLSLVAIVWGLFRIGGWGSRGRRPDRRDGVASRGRGRGRGLRRMKVQTPTTPWILKSLPLYLRRGWWRYGFLPKTTHIALRCRECPNSGTLFVLALNIDGAERSLT